MLLFLCLLFYIYIFFDTYKDDTYVYFYIFL